MSKKQNYTDINEQTPMSGRRILWHGICGRCPKCGHGKVFESYLKQVAHCQNCQEDIGSLRADDGPAWLTILLVGHIIVPFIAFFALNEAIQQWLLMVILFALVIGLVFLLLPRCKGFFIAALWLIENKPQ